MYSTTMLRKLISKSIMTVVFYKTHSLYLYKTFFNNLRNFFLGCIGSISPMETTLERKNIRVQYAACKVSDDSGFMREISEKYIEFHYVAN